MKESLLFWVCTIFLTATGATANTVAIVLTLLLIAIFLWKWLGVTKEIENAPASLALLRQQAVFGIMHDRVNDSEDKRILNAKENERLLGDHAKTFVNNELILVKNHANNFERYERRKCEETLIFWRYQGQDQNTYIQIATLAEFLDFAAECGGFDSKPEIPTIIKDGQTVAVEEGLYFPNRRYVIGGYWHHIVSAIDPNTNEVWAKFENLVKRTMLLRGESLVSYNENKWIIRDEKYRRSA